MSPIIFGLCELLCAFFIVMCVRAMLYSHVNIFDSTSHNVMVMLFDRVAEAGFDYQPESVRSLVLIGGIVSVVCGLVFSPVVALCAPVAVGAIAWVFLNYRVKQCQKSNQRNNDEICYFIARSLRAGHSLDSGIKASYVQFPRSLFLQSVHRHLSAGAALPSAIERVSGDEFEISTSEKMLCATISLSYVMGGNSARIFERIGDCFHQTYELESDTSSALAQVRMSAYVIGVLPVVMVAFSLLLGSQTTMFLFTHPIGWACLFFGVLFEICGALWMKKLVTNGVGIWTS